MPKVWVWIKELSRVLKPGGKLITINPVSWPYHEAPIDCWRIYPEAMKELYAHAGVSVEFCEFETLDGDPYWNRRAGRGVERHGKMQSLCSKLFHRFGYRVECAYDTVTIGTKL